MKVVQTDTNQYEPDESNTDKHKYTRISHEYTGLLHE